MMMEVFIESVIVILAMVLESVEIPLESVIVIWL